MLKALDKEAELRVRLKELEMLRDVHCNCEICFQFRVYFETKILEYKQKLKEYEKK